MGASGSIYGILACVLLDLILNFRIVKNRWRELARLVVTIVASLSVGLLPYIDNFSHVGGFIIGLLTGLLILPTINFGKWDRRWKICARSFSIPILITFYTYLVVNFYTGTQSDCPWCKYMDCLPILGWCDNYN